MPDTGAPWNIPYVEAADLVSDWPADSLALANAIDAGLDAAGNAGIGSNVVQTVKTDTFSTTSGTMVDVTGFTATITPTSNTSKILVIVTAVWGNSVDGYIAWNLRRGSTDIATATGGTTAATRILRTVGAGWTDGDAVVFLDSPATSAATTYGLQLSQIGGGTAYMGRGGFEDRRSVSSLTLIEVAA